LITIGCVPDNPQKSLFTDRVGCLQASAVACRLKRGGSPLEDTKIMTPEETAYTLVGETLRDRILALIPSHPEILSLTGPFDLFRIEGFECDDLGPSLAQASWALSAAKSQHMGTN
jgi:hypothetical protein